MMAIPDPNQVHPNPAIQELVFLKNVITRPNIEVGDYTYYDDPVDPMAFESHVTHHYDFLGDRLIIGKFCSIAQGIEFVMNGANHVMRGASTYPFNILGGDWQAYTPELSDLPLKGDTIVGNDVWLGQNVTVLPGVTIGDGAIVGADSVVTKSVPPYTIVGGNPAQMIRPRFKDEVSQALLKLAWWDQDIHWITAHISALTQTTPTISQLNTWLAELA
ncbi:acetyltransferase [Lactobacillus heilongjiangensis] [Lactiplantibacillus mudanjiangensis]|uniref:Acetyltransferase [Lactobacillus heilongjiangensis] n=2 Tax=Lactiplantibacillus mudanjiangensis TaxID=1296538 RepID=A0A660E3P1_9LACO|nr:acetyltransferase [Lactobacillus heilongjiangensis] [Lactiplantibacillus mudanjiangensis]VDG28735.1 acetyltransferase [Lactobacillus heilongjiangensis] [Lactiplantibacillus mudanjiangensis]